MVEQGAPTDGSVLSETRPSSRFPASGRKRDDKDDGGALLFDYRRAIRESREEWRIEMIQVFRALDAAREGVISRESAVRVLRYIGIEGDEYFHASKRNVTLKMFLDAVATDRGRTVDQMYRWRFVFRLIAGSDSDTITIPKLQAFFRMWGHEPHEAFCEDFIDEFDRISLSRTEVNLEDWLVWCRVHQMKF